METKLTYSVAKFDDGGINVVCRDQRQPNILKVIAIFFDHQAAIDYVRELDTKLLWAPAKITKQAKPPKVAPKPKTNGGNGARVHG